MLTLILKPPVLLPPLEPELEPLPSGPFDIEIFPANDNHEDLTECSEDISSFLRQLFNRGPKAEKPPLELSKRTVKKVGGRLAVQIKFQRSKAGMEKGVSFEDAAEEFCKRMFYKETGSIIGGLTTKDIRGVSAISEVFKTYWTRAMFTECLKRGPELFKRINPNTPNQESFLPAWALGLSVLRLVAGSNFGKMASLFGVRNEHVTAFGSVTNSQYEGAISGVVTQLLRTYVDKSPTLSANDEKKRWKACHENFKRCMNRVSDKIDELQCSDASGIKNKGLSALHSYEYRIHYREALCNTVYEATVSAGEIFSLNHEMLEIFTKIKTASGYSAFSSGIETASSLSLLVSSIKMTADTTVQPLREWSLQKIFFQRQLPMETNMTFGSTNMYGLVTGLLGFGWNAYKCIDHLYEMKKSDRQINYHKAMVVNITASWAIAHKILTLLQLVQCTDAQNVTDVAFVDAKAQAWWMDYVAEVKRIRGGGAPSEEEFGANAVLLYLGEQRLKWEVFQSQFNALECTC